MTDVALENFKTTTLGRSLMLILANPGIRDEMRHLSRCGEPAITALGTALVAFGIDLDDRAKRLAGKMVKDVLSDEFILTKKSARVAPGALFKSGAVYAEAR